VRSATFAQQREAVPAPESWVSVDDVAKHLGVVTETVYRWIENKGLPAQEIGKLWKLKISEVDAWVRAGGVAPQTRTGGKPFDLASARRLVEELLP
jgi:excisionase family DNA binding protein